MQNSSKTKNKFLDLIIQNKFLAIFTLLFIIGFFFAWGLSLLTVPAIIVNLATRIKFISKQKAIIKFVLLIIIGLIAFPLSAIALIASPNFQNSSTNLNAQRVEEEAKNTKAQEEKDRLVRERKESDIKAREEQKAQEEKKKQEEDRIKSEKEAEEYNRLTNPEKLKKSFPKFDFSEENNGELSIGNIKLAETSDFQYKKFINSFIELSSKAYELGYSRFTLQAKVDALTARGDTTEAMVWLIRCTKKYCSQIRWDNFDQTEIFKRFDILASDSAIRDSQYGESEFSYTISRNLSKLQQSETIYFNRGLGIFK